jgi:hypothetical protein
MSLQTWVECLVSAQGDGTQISDSSVAASLLPAAAKITLPTNFFYIGRVLRVTACGRISNVVTTPGTLTLDFRLGSVVAFNGGAMQLSTTAHTNVPWWWSVLLTCRAIGSGTSANLMGQADFFSQAANISGADTTTGHSHLLNPNSAPGVGTGFDSTTTNQVDMFGKFSVTTDPTQITLHQFILESLN